MGRQYLHSLCLLVALACLALSCCGKEHTLEHSFAGNDFTIAGYIEGDGLFQESDLVLTRVPLDELQREQLLQAIKQDGFYTVRIAGTPIVASVRASCLAADVSQQKEEVQLLVNEEGDVVGMAYSLTSPTCHSSATPPLKIQLSSSCPVGLKLPHPGPAVVVNTPGGPSAFGAASGYRASPASQPRQERGGAGGSGLSSDASESEPAPPTAPPVDERTWLQKNWLFCIAGFMMFLNLGGKLAGGGAAAGPPAGGAAANAGDGRGQAPATRRNA